MLQRLLLVVVFCLAACPAFAEVKDFGTFSVDVTDGWVVVMEDSDDDYSTAVIANTDKATILTISTNGIEANATLHEVAAEYAGIFSGEGFTMGKPKPVGDKIHIPGRNGPVELLMVVSADIPAEEASVIILIGDKETAEAMARRIVFVKPAFAFK